MTYKRHNDMLTLHGAKFTDINKKVTPQVFQALHTQSFVIVGDASIYSMSLDEQNVVDSDIYSHTPGQTSVTIQSSGWYEISYKVNHKYEGTGNGKPMKTRLKASVKINDTEENKSITLVEKSDDLQDSTNTWAGLLYFDAGDYIEIILQRFGGSKWDLHTIESAVSIRKL